MTSARTILATLASALVVGACGGETAATPSPTPSPVHSPSPSAGITFRLDPVDPGGSAKGTVLVNAGSASTTIELKITGLQATSRHVAHVHVGTCQSRGGIAFALNPVVADGQGVADTTTTLNQAYPPAAGHWYVVVHAGSDMQGSNANYLLCGNLF